MGSINISVLNTMYLSSLEIDFYCIFFYLDFIIKGPNFLKTKSRPKKRIKNYIAKGCLEYILFVVKLFLPKDQSIKRIGDLDIGKNLTH